VKTPFQINPDYQPTAHRSLARHHRRSHTDLCYPGPTGAN